MIRRPIPGCAGPLVNIACIEPAMTAHCNAFRRDPQVIFTFRAELARSWDVFTYPLRRYDPPTTAQPTPAGSQTNAQTDATPSSSPQPSQIRTMPLDSDRCVSVSALRLSLQSGIKPASAAEALDNYDETDDASRGTGVFAFPKTPAGNMNWKSSLEIGTRDMGRETWTRDLGASTRRFSYTRWAGGSEDGYEQNESRTLISLQEALYASATPPAEPPLMPMAAHTEPAAFEAAILALPVQPSPHNVEESCREITGEDTHATRQTSTSHLPPKNGKLLPDK